MSFLLCARTSRRKFYWSECTRSKPDKSCQRSAPTSHARTPKPRIFLGQSLPVRHRKLVMFDLTRTDISRFVIDQLARASLRFDFQLTLPKASVYLRKDLFSALHPLFWSKFLLHLVIYLFYLFIFWGVGRTSRTLPGSATEVFGRFFEITAFENSGGKMTVYGVNSLFLELTKMAVFSGARSGFLVTFRIFRENFNLEVEKIIGAQSTLFRATLTLKTKFEQFIFFEFDRNRLLEHELFDSCWF